MREITCECITDTVEKLCVKAATFLPPDVGILLECACDSEPSKAGQAALCDIVENFKYAAEAGLPICQDTGMTVVFLDLGQDAHIVGGDLYAAVNEGVRRGYVNGALRKSVVRDPLRRENTNDNTPAVIHVRIVPGDKLDITVAPKGFGSENMSAMKMLLPSAGEKAVEDFIVGTVDAAGSNPCPPVIVGVGLGGTVEMAALLAKRALVRPADQRNPDEYYAAMENRLLRRINRLGIGPQGFGGISTALAVNIEVYPTHIAGLPCVVNMSCHATRHASAAL
ncbi:MAG: fumarate hydratase [Oscillospiraceae bacterium]|nr:fumarate hydratase [Oscillospiraceae bacterium]